MECLRSLAQRPAHPCHCASPHTWYAEGAPLQGFSFRVPDPRKLKLHSVIQERCKKSFHPSGEERVRTVIFVSLADRHQWGLNIVGLGVLIASLVFSVILCVLKYRFTYNALATGSFLLLLAGWTFIVTPDWVYRAANTYAERLFDALDEKTELDETVTSKIEMA
jgi:hypothetical protein